MSVLKSPTLILPEELASGTSVLPKITWELIEQEILETLYQVLHYLHPVADTDTSIVNVLGLDAIRSKAFLDFFERTFPGTLATEKPAIWVEHTGEYQLVVDLSKPLNVGSLVSFLAFVVNFHFTKQLSFIFYGIYNLSEYNDVSSFSFVSGFDDTEARKDDNLQPIIFQSIKKTLLSTRLKQVVPGQKKEFNKILYPNSYVGNLHEIFDKYISDITWGASRSTIRTGISPLERRTQTLDLAHECLQKTSPVKAVVAKEYLDVIFENIFNKILSPSDTIKLDSKLKFDNVVLGCGDGSDTIGFFDEKNIGVSFFQYRTHLDTSLKKIVVDPCFKSLKSPARSKPSIINLNVFGIDESATISGYEPGFGTVEIAVNGHIFRIDFKKEFETKIMVAIPQAITITTATLNSNHNGFQKIKSVVPPVSGSSLWKLFENVGDTIPVFTFDASSFELYYESDEKDVGIYVTSGNLIPGNDKEEFFLIASVVENILKQFKFELVNLFENDRFELSKATRDDQFLNDVSPKDLLEIAKLFSLDTTTFEKICEVNVVGKFIGKKDTKGAVVTDKDYTIYRTTTSTHTATSKIEQFIPPTSGSESDLYYAKLRYSKGSVEYSSNKLKIYIESFVSPLRSRLDKRILGPNLDSTGNPETDIFDYRPTLAGRKADVLDIHTLFGSGVSPDAYLLMNENEPFDATSNPKLASYNQLLSALRSLGVLEALIDRILARANEELAKSISDVTRDANDLNTTNIMNNIQIILSNVKCATIRESEDPTSTIKTIDINTYRALKWYVSPEDKNRFEHTN